MEQIANSIRNLVEGYNKAFPAVLEIPSKDHPYGEDSLALFHRELICR